MMPISRVPAVALAALLWSGIAAATNGYFSHGYGARNESMAGAGIAFSEGAIAPATNPAGIAGMPRRLDAGVNWFVPSRGGSIKDNAFGPDEAHDGDGVGDFFIPSFGIVYPLDGDLTLGFTAYGNGGMNTTYEKSNPFGRFGASGTAGVDLAQLFIGPTLAWRVTDNQNLGASVNFVYQRFKATGLDAFTIQSFPGPFSESPDHVTNQGYDDSHGWSLHLGWQAHYRHISLGATWQPQTHMRKFDDYRGLFANQGGFDIPGWWGVGVALHPTPALVIALDYQRIQYGEVDSIANPLSNFSRDGALLGSDQGPGFGWRDINVYKLGVNYHASANLTLRAGFSRNQQPIPNDQTLFNILAPGVIVRHYTLGGTWRYGRHEFTLNLMLAPREAVRGENSIPEADLPLPPESFGGGEADIHLKERTIGLAYGYVWGHDS